MYCKLQFVSKSILLTQMQRNYWKVTPAPTPRWKLIQVQVRVDQSKIMSFLSKSFIGRQQKLFSEGLWSSPLNLLRDQSMHFKTSSPHLDLENSGDNISDSQVGRTDSLTSEIWWQDGGNSDSSQEILSAVSDEESAGPNVERAQDINNSFFQLPDSLTDLRKQL